MQVDGTAAPPTLHPAPNIAGKIEIRGIGVIAVPYIQDISLRLVVNLDLIVERLPCDRQTHSIAAFDVPTINLAAFEASAPIKIEYALRSLVDGAIFPVATQSSDRTRKRNRATRKTEAAPQVILLVTGLSGAGKTTVLKTLEDIGWEAVDNFPSASPVLYWIFQAQRSRCT